MTFSFSDYSSWLTAGRGGIPHNFLGYILMKVLSFFRRETTSVATYIHPKTLAAAGPYSSKTYLPATALPRRSGKRPKLVPWTLPQRQVEERSSDEIRALFEPFVASLAKADPKRLIARTSRLERYGPALFLDDAVAKHAGAEGSRNEIAHLHEIDGSMHVMLAPGDAKVVIERGWGERFGLSGGLLPAGYVLLYAPRDGEEWGVVQEILRAGVGWMVGDDGLEVAE